MAGNDGPLSPFTPPANEGERATRSRMRDLKREVDSYRSLVDISNFSSDNDDKLVCNESRDVIINIVQALRSDETISPNQKVHVDKIVAEALSLLRNTHRFVFDPAPTELSNLSVIDSLPSSAPSGGTAASGRSASVLSVREAGQLPTATGHVESVGPVADADRSHDEVVGGSK